MNIPIVTLDKIYIEPDNENIYFFDCTRIDGSKKLVTRSGGDLFEQIKILGNILTNKKIFLADDVVFSGEVLKTIIKMLGDVDIQVLGIISSISTRGGYEYFSKELKYGIFTNYLLEEDVIDQICERDFYFGIAGSGILVRYDNCLYKAPYFKPFGNPSERASIPEEYVESFSKNCIDRSICLFEDIDRQKDEKTLISELPEKIILTDGNEEVIKTLIKRRNEI